MSNPTTIISFSAVFAGLGINYVRDEYLSAGLMVLGIFPGSMLWWLVLSTSVNHLRSKFTQKMLKFGDQCLRHRQPLICNTLKHFSLHYPVFFGLNTWLIVARNEMLTNLIAATSAFRFGKGFDNFNGLYILKYSKMDK